jgi:hypothetical protein
MIEFADWQRQTNLENRRTRYTEQTDNLQTGEQAW